MQDFPGNSQKAKARSEAPTPAAGPKIERITTATAEHRKPGLGRKVKEAFIGGSARGAVEGMVSEVVIPKVRDMIFEAIESGFHSLIYGDSSRGRRAGAPSGYSNVGRFNYNAINRPTPAAQPTTISRQSRARQDFGEIIIESRQEANEVIDTMFEIVSQWGSVPVSTLYDLTGITSTHVDQTWGWTSLKGAKARRRGDGRYVLDLPYPQSLT